MLISRESFCSKRQFLDSGFWIVKIEGTQNVPNRKHFGRALRCTHFASARMVKAEVLDILGRNEDNQHIGSAKGCFLRFWKNVLPLFKKRCRRCRLRFGKTLKRRNGLKERRLWLSGSVRIPRPSKLLSKVLRLMASWSHSFAS